MPMAMEVFCYQFHENLQPTKSQPTQIRKSLSYRDKHLAGKTSLVIISVYRHPNTDVDYALYLCGNSKHEQIGDSSID